ncbi:MAG: transporter permease [Xanthobacteraceae bacterium]|nr:transporter permease [Xanthobacteraceae bacterium]
MTLVLPPTAPVRRWPRLPRQSGFIFGAGVLVFFVLCALLAPVISPYSPYDQSLDGRLMRPVFMGGEWSHILGTDTLGRDYLSRLIYGTRVSLLIGFGTVAVSCLIGTTLGLLAGYYRGRVDLVVGFIINVRLSLPIILVAISVVGIVGNTLPIIILVLSGLLWDRFAVVIRALTMQIREREFVLSARAAGAGDLRIVVCEILPNVAGGLVVVATLEIAHAILLEAALSFLGLGVQPPTASWGQMIAEAKDVVFFESWLINIPGLTLLVLVLGINVLGDALRNMVAPSGRPL